MGVANPPVGSLSLVDVGSSWCAAPLTPSRTPYTSPKSGMAWTTRYHDTVHRSTNLSALEISNQRWMYSILTVNGVNLNFLLRMNPRTLQM